MEQYNIEVQKILRTLRFIEQMPDNFNSNEIEHYKFLVKRLVLFDQENNNQHRLNQLVNWTNFKTIEDMDIDEFMQGLDVLEGGNENDTDFLVTKSKSTNSKRMDNYQLEVVKDEMNSKAKEVIKLEIINVLEVANISIELDKDKLE